jgi:hypothetical protein
MADLRRLRAGLRLTVVFGLFWGVAGAIGRLGYELVTKGLGAGSGIWSGVFRSFLLGGTLGVIGGALYTTGLVLLGRRQEGGGLSTGRAAILGAIAGVGASFAIRAWGVAGLSGVSPLGFAVGSAVVLGLLGAAMSAAILGTARRSAPEIEERKSGRLTP